MCGIAAILQSREVDAPPEDMLATMVKQQVHRGPDAEGIVRIAGGGAEAHLGHRRLAVIDLTPAGAQPMMSQDGVYCIIYNGEIYNYRQLRSELSSDGIQFRSRSDTEVLLHWLIQKGKDRLDVLRGIYSFVLFDKTRGEAFAAVDPVGVKPLYWTEEDGRLLIASELKAIIPLLRNPRISPVGLAEYFHRLCIPAPHTIIEGVFKLAPGSRLQWNAKDGVKLIGAPPLPRPHTNSDPEETWDYIHRAVERRWIADVPVGVFLSGGLDSGTIVAASRQVRQDNDLRTFTIGYEEPYRSFNELDQARRTAEFHSTQHLEEIITPSVTDQLGAIAYHLDEPFADSGALPTWWVCAHASKHVTVAISGVGGDECFGGYPRYQAFRLAGPMNRIPLPARRLLGRISQFIPESDSSTNYGGRASRFLRALPAIMEERYIQWVTFDDSDLSSILPEALWKEVVENDQDPLHRDRALLLTLLNEFSPSEAAAFFDIHTYVPADLLFMADRISMAHGLELRVPFCDVDLIQHVFGLPPKIKYRKGQLKGHLKNVLNGKLPEEILTGRKRGFMVPAASWIRTDLSELVSASADEIVERDWVRREWISKIMGDHQQGKRSRSDELWALVMLAQWGRSVWDTLAK
jgi:asparagine synthase (glutamine-hydrolysing)